MTAGYRYRATVLALFILFASPAFSQEVLADLDDDFDSFTLNPVKWEVKEAHGVEVSIMNGELFMNGTRNGGGDWANDDTWTHIETVDWFRKGVEVEYRNRVGGSGTGYGSGITFFQDPLNHIDIGPLYDPGGGSNVTLAAGGRVNGAWLSVMRLDNRPIDSLMHSFGIKYRNDGMFEIYVDGNRVGRLDADLEEFSVRLYAHTRLNGDSVRAYFDDFNLTEEPVCEPVQDTWMVIALVVLFIIAIAEFVVIIILLVKK